MRCTQAERKSQIVEGARVEAQVFLKEIKEEVRR